MSRDDAPNDAKLPEKVGVVVLDDHLDVYLPGGGEGMVGGRGVARPQGHQRVSDPRGLGHVAGGLGRLVSPHED